MRNFDDILLRLTPKIHGVLGKEVIILTRQSGLTAAKGGLTPSTLALAADAAAGDTSISLKLAGGGGVRGRLQDGCRLTLANVVYIVQAEVTLPAPPTASETITPVTIAPPLAAGAAVDAVVTLAGPEYTWTDGLVIRVGRSSKEDDPHTLMHMEVSLPTLTAPTQPRKGDGFYRPRDGTRGSIAKIPVEFGGSWDVEIGTE